MATFFMVKIKTRNIVTVMLMALLLLPTEMLTASTRSVEQARQLALRQMTKKGGDRAKGIGKADLKLVYTQDNTKAEPCYYVFATKPTEGFTIVSGDDRFPEIVGYTTNGDFDFNKMPPALKKMLEAYKTFSVTATDEQIEEIKNVQAAMAGRSNIEPMIKTKWDQPYPYNIYCPMLGNQQTVTGCVATAISQLLYYHRCPEKLLADIPSYTTNRYKFTMPEIKAGEKYDWDNMCLTYTGDETDAQKEAVARLMLHAGCAMEMDYGQISYARPALEKLAECFGLDKDIISNILRGNYGLKDWTDIVYNELADRRPVLYNASSFSDAHTFIVDGYENGLFSINWGWSGYNDGLFELTGLLNYTSTADMVIGICPDNGKTDPNGNPNLSVLRLIRFTGDRIRNLRYENGKLKATAELEFLNNHDSPNSAKVAVAYRDKNNNIVKVSEARDISLNSREFGSFDFELSFNAAEGEMYKMFAIENSDEDKWNVNEIAGIELPVIKILDGQPLVVGPDDFITATAKFSGSASGKVGEDNNFIVTLSNSSSIDYESYVEVYISYNNSKPKFIDNCNVSIPANGKAKFSTKYCAPKAGDYTIWISKSNNTKQICKTTLTFTIQGVQTDEIFEGGQGTPDEGWLWGYYRGNSMDDIREIVGEGGAGTYSAMICVPTSKIKGMKVKGIRLACTEDMGDVTFWIREYYHSADLATKTIKSEEGKFIEAIFDQPYAIPDKDSFGDIVDGQKVLCFGYTFTSKAAPVFPTAGKNQFNYSIARTDAENNMWFMSQTNGDDNAIQLILNKVLPEIGASAEWKDNSVVMRAGENGLAKLILANNSKNEIADFDYIIDNGTIKETGHIVLEKPLPAGIDVQRIVEIPFKSSSYISKNSFVDFKITKINGKNYNDNKSARLNTIVCSNDGIRRTLVEDYTGTGCGFCVRGTVGLENLKKQFGDKAIILSYHIYSSDDPMWIEWGNYYNNGTSSLPYAAADRRGLLDPGFLSLHFEEINSIPTIANVDVSASWNEDGTSVEAYTDITPLTNDLNVKIAYMLKADGLTGSGPEWAQVNGFAWEDPDYYVDFPYYEGIKKYMRGEEYGDVTPIVGFVYDNAVIASTYQDFQTSIPALTGLSDGQTLHHNYSIPLNVNEILKKSIIPDKVSVVAIVEDMDGNVINAAEALVKPCTTGISELGEGKATARKIYTIDGRETSKMSNGINIIKMSDGTVKKVVKK